jgi:hypothetical protein
MDTCARIHSVTAIGKNIELSPSGDMHMVHSFTLTLRLSSRSIQGPRTCCQIGEYLLRTVCCVEACNITKTIEDCTKDMRPEQTPCWKDMHAYREHDKGPRKPHLGPCRSLYSRCTAAPRSCRLDSSRQTGASGRGPRSRKFWKVREAVAVLAHCVSWGLVA